MEEVAGRNTGINVVVMIGRDAQFARYVNSTLFRLDFSIVESMLTLNAAVAVHV
jgi:hypothetical protein